MMLETFFASRRARRSAAVALGLTAALVLSGCQPGSSNSGMTERGGDETLDVWHYYSGAATAPFEDLLARYSAETGIPVKPRLIPFGDFNRTLLQAATAGKLPDVVLINAFDTGLFAEAGMIIDISDDVSEWGQQDEYFDGPWATTQMAGETFAVPHVADTYALWYNATDLTEAGVGVPTTWDEVETAAETLTEGQNYGLAYAGINGVEGSTAWILRFLAAGGDISQIESPAGVVAMESFMRMNGTGTSPGVLTWGEDDATIQFQNQTASMMINSASYINAVTEAGVDWKVAPMPSDAEKTTFLSAENLAITSDSDNVAGSWDLIEWLQQPDVMNEYLPERNKLPVRKDTAEDKKWDDPALRTFIDQLDIAWAPNETVSPKSAEIFTAAQAALQAALSGSSSVDSALADAQKVIDKALE